MLKNNLVNINTYMIYSLLIFSILSVRPPVNTYIQHPIEVDIYSFPETFILKMIGYFNNKSDCKVIFHSLNDSANSERFLKIVNTLVVQGVVIKHFCPCGESDVTQNDIWLTYVQPLVGFFHEGELMAMTVGSIDYKILDEAFMMTPNGDVKIFTPYGVYSLADEDIRVRLEELFEKEKSSNTKINSLDLVLPITLLAFTDSVNPCTFAVFTALLLMALHSSGRNKIVVTGFSFILAVFIGYYALGLGLLQILVYIPFIDKVVAVVGLIIGAFSITRSLKSRFKSPIPKILRRFMEVWISKSYMSLIASFAVGLTTSFTLLPCTSGPYLVGLGLLSTLGDSIQAYLLLTLYDTIFLSPLIVILTALLTSNNLIRKIKAFRSSKLGVMELTSGVILVLLCIYLLAS